MPDMPTSVSRVVCVVGARGGIGAASVAQFRSQPATQVVSMDRAVGDASGDVSEPFYAIDLSKAVDVEAAFAAARREHPKLDALVLAAGIVDSERVATLGLDRWQQIIDVNLTGCFLAVKSALPWLRDGGRIVFISSLAGRTGGVLTGPAYAASKGGLESFAKSLATELAPRRITVNCVAPGAVETEMIRTHTPERRSAMVAGTPLKRMALPEEIAAAVSFLASSEAAFITGTVLPVNGGVRMD